MKKFIFFFVFLILSVSFISATTTNFFTNSGNSFLESSWGKNANSEYSTSYLNINSQGIMSGINSRTNSELDTTMCRDGTDFLLQVAPFSCTPAVVRSDLLEEQDVPVFCKIEAMKINPLIDVSYIQNINFGNINSSKGIRSINFYPKFSGLWRNRLVNDLSDPLEYQDLGYAVVVLKRNTNESSMPEFVEGNVRVSMKYNLQEAFGIRDNTFYLPQMDDETWDNEKVRYSFWKGKGYLRAEGVDANSATINLYTDKYQNTLGNEVNREKVKYASFNLKEGESTNPIYIPGVDCLASLTMTLDRLEVPGTYAILRVNSEYFQVKRGESFLDGKCTVKSLNIAGEIQEVKMNCKGDEKSEQIILSSYPKVDIKIDGQTKSVTVGDKIIEVEKDGVQGSIYLTKMQIINAKLKGREDQNNNIKVSLAYVEGATASKLSFDQLKGIRSSTTLKLYDSTDFNKVDKGNKTFVFSGLSNSNYENLDSEVKTYYSNANSDFDEIISNFYNSIDPIGGQDKLSESSYVQMIKLAIYLNQADDVKKVCNSFKESYPDSEGYSNLCETGKYTLNSGTMYKEILMDGDMKGITLENIYEPTPEEYGAKIQITKVNDKSYSQTILLSKGNSFNLSEENSIGTDYLELQDGLTENSANVGLFIANIKRTSERQNLAGSLQSNSYNNYNLKLTQGEIISQGGYEFLLLDTNLMKQAKVSLKVGANRAASETNFSYKIGIEKRAIKLSPEKTQERIDDLNKTIEEWTKLNDGLSKVVQGMKTACLATGSAFTIKNLVENLGGKAIARQEVMQGSGGWNEKCADFTKLDSNYVSMEDCLFSNADKIDSQVSAYDSQIQKQNAELKSLQIKHLQEGGNFIEGKTINQPALAEDYLTTVNNDVKILSDKNATLNALNSELPSFDLNNFILNSNEYNKNYNFEDLKNIDLYSRILAENPNDETARAKLYGEVYELNKNQQSGAELQTFVAKTGLSSSFVDSSNLKQLNVSNIEIFSESKYYAFNQGANSKLKDASKVAGYKNLLSGKEYLLQYDDDGAVIGTYSISEQKLVPVEEDNGNPLGLTIKFFTEDKLQNEYLNPELRYYEDGTYKGLPSVVPVDKKDGWYAYMDEGAYLPGQLDTYYDSGTVNSFWLCNVGPNKIEEFNIANHDDSCTMINLRTGQTDFQISGLKQDKSSALVREAVNNIRTASKMYKNGIREVNFGGNTGNIKVGSPEVNIPDVRCTDIMSPKECQILFNVCDPVLCPSSRCDFGGKYPVKDVIQSGIVGSLVLCAPNWQEGIYMPICLTGIQAGMDNWLTVTKSYQDCLQESLDTGQTVGICDEINSVYLCEMFWRQAAPLVNLALPKVISALAGQNNHGGGEYMTFNSAWTNFQNSYKYFTNFYASNSYSAFKLRSSDEVGGLVCKSYASVAYPSGASLLDVLTQPDSPPQYTAKFDEIPLTTATNPPTSQYKVFYHIFAGKDRGAYYRVYLREGPTSSYYQDLRSGRLIASGYINKGEYKTDTVDFTYPSGYKQLCVNVNGQEECGFGEATTSFAYNYLEDAYINETVTNFNITSEKECVSGSASWYSLLNPNIQEGINDLIDPQIYNEGIIRICANENPGNGSDLLVNGVNARWKDVGYCGDESMRCWLDTYSLDNAFKFATTQNQSLTAIENNTISKLIANANAMNLEEYKLFVTKIKNEPDFQLRIDWISGNLSRVYEENQYANLLFLRGKSYAELAKFLFTPKAINVLGIGLFPDGLSLINREMNNALLYTGFFLKKNDSTILVSAIGSGDLSTNPISFYASPGVSKSSDLTKVERDYNYIPFSIEESEKFKDAIQKPYFVEPFEVSSEDFSKLKIVSVKYYSSSNLKDEGVRVIDNIPVKEFISRSSNDGSPSYSVMKLNLIFDVGMKGAPVLDFDNKVIGMLWEEGGQVEVLPISLLGINPSEEEVISEEQSEPNVEEMLDSDSIISSSIKLKYRLAKDICLKYYDSEWHLNEDCGNEWFKVNQVKENNFYGSEGKLNFIASLENKDYLNGIDFILSYFQKATAVREISNDEIVLERESIITIDRVGATTPLKFIYQGEPYKGWLWTPNKNFIDGDKNNESSIVTQSGRYYQPGEWVKVPELEYKGELVGYQTMPLAESNKDLILLLDGLNFKEGIALMFADAESLAKIESGTETGDSANSGAYQIALSSDDDKIYMSNDYGNSWTAKESDRYWGGISISSTGKYQTAVASSDKIYISNDYGNSWTAKESDRYWGGISISSTGKYQTAVASSDKIYISNDYGNSWTAKESDRYWWDISISSTGKYQTAVAPSDKIYMSNDYGNSWTAKESDRDWTSVSISSTGKYQTAIDYGGMIYVSNDYGNSWTAKESDRYWKRISVSSNGKYQTAIVGNDLTAIGMEGKIYVSNDYGNSWTAKESDRDWTSVSISSTGKYQTAVARMDKIYVSNDYGNTWDARGFSGNWSYILVASSASSSANSLTSICGNEILQTAKNNLGEDIIRPFSEAKDNPCATFVTNVLASTSCLKNLPEEISVNNQQCQSIDYLLKTFQGNSALFLEIGDKKNLRPGDIVIFGKKSNAPDKTQHSSIFVEYNSDKSLALVISDPGEALPIKQGYYEIDGTDWYVSYAFRYIGASNLISSTNQPVAKVVNINNQPQANEQIIITEQKKAVLVETRTEISQTQIAVSEDSKVVVCENKPLEVCEEVKSSTNSNVENVKVYDLSEIFPNTNNQIEINVPSVTNPSINRDDILYFVLPMHSVSTNSKGELVKETLIVPNKIIVTNALNVPIPNLKVEISAPTLAGSTIPVIETTDSEGSILLEDLMSQVRNSDSAVVSSNSEFFSYVNYVNQNLISNGYVNKRCDCGGLCTDYSNWINSYSQTNGIDPLLSLSLIIQESGCNLLASSSSSYGLMQINCDVWKGKYGIPSNVNECKNYLINNPKENIRIGLAILKDNYEKYEDKNIQFSCQGRTVSYTGWDAALRAYNGLRCTSDQNHFVEEVNFIYGNLRAASSEITFISSASQETLAYQETGYSIYEEGEKYYFNELISDCNNNNNNNGLTGAVINSDGNSSCTVNTNKLKIYVQSTDKPETFVLKADRTFVGNLFGTFASFFSSFKFSSGDPVLGYISMEEGNKIYDKTDLSQEFFSRLAIDAEKETNLVKEFRYAYEGKNVNAKVLSKVKKAAVTDLNNGFKNAHCGCQNQYECMDYAYFLDKYSQRYNVPYEVVLALILQETECNQELVSSSGAYGVSQITENTFDEHCSSVLKSFEEVQGANNLGKNIHCGFRIVKDKYSTFKDGIIKSSIYQNNEAFRELIDTCMSKYPSYVDYSSWQAAYRAYNGFGCDQGADLDYVDKLQGYYEALVNLG